MLKRQFLVRVDRVMRSWMWCAIPLVLSAFVAAQDAPYSSRNYDSYAAVGQLTGILLPIQDVTLSAPIAGTVASIFYQEGDQVSEGALLMELDSSADVIDAQRFEQVLQKRQFDHDSSQRLFDDRVVSADELLESEIELNIAKLDLQQAQLNIERKRFIAPFNGVLVRLNFDENEWVEQSQPVLDFVDTTQILVRLVVSPELASNLRKGQHVEVVDAGDSRRTGLATLDFIDPRVDAQSGLRRIHLLLDNPDGTWIPGMRVTVKISNR